MKGKTIKLKFSGNTVNFFKKNGTSILFLIFVIAGFFCGVIFSVSADNPLDWLYGIIYRSFLGIRLSGGFLSVFLYSACSSLLLVCVAFISGMSLAGLPILAVISLFKGFIYGTIGGCLVSFQSFRGFCFYVAIVLLPCVLSVAATILACRESCSFSVFLIKSFISGSKGALLNDFKVYCLRYIIIFGIVFSSAVADMLLSCTFAGMFNITIT